MSGTHIKEDMWNFRKFDKRPILTKAKNNQTRKILATDILSNLSIGLEAAETIPIESVEVEKEYLATIKVYTAKNIKAVGKENIDFFEALDIDQSFEDFIKAYQVYADYIKFELTETEKETE